MLVLALALSTSGARGADTDGGAAAPSGLPACIQVGTEARYVPYGYNHLVTITSGCKRPSTCTVSTDVSPEPRSVDVPANGRVVVTTFLGAAASTFSARVSCALR